KPDCNKQSIMVARDAYECVAPLTVRDNATQMHPRGDACREDAERLIFCSEFIAQFNQRFEIEGGRAAEWVDRNHFRGERSHELHVLVSENAIIRELA